MSTTADLRGDATSAQAEVQRRLFNVDEYHRMADSGIFGPGERLELIDGVIYDKDADAIGPRPFTVAEYEQMADLGILTDEERFELIEGVILVMSRTRSPHAACVKRLTTEFTERLGRRVILGVQDPIRLDEQNEPEPDIALARPREDFYESGHPGPADLFLVVEVMDTSAYHDRKVKLPLYARSGIPETWLVDLAHEFIEVHRRPVEGAYTETMVRRRGQTIAPEAFPDVALAVDAILSRVEP